MLLAQLEDGTSVCHGDYHPDNVMLTPKGPVIIDWLTAGYGNPHLDMARTVLLLSIGEPPDVGPVTRRLLRLLRKLFRNGYLAAYAEVRPYDHNAVGLWLPIAAAARLQEGVPGEEARLVAIAMGDLARV
jgi:aminoglycoside phosphotransferase (APT) family kinase protein